MHRLSVLDGNVHYYVHYYVKLKVKSWTTVSLSTCKTLMESVIVVRGPGKWNMDISFTCYTYTSKISTVAERRGEASESDISDFRGWDPQHWGGEAGNTCLDILTKELPVVELEAARDLAGLCSLLMICDTPQSASLLSDVTVLASHWSMSSSLASHWWTVDIFPCSWC